MTFRVLDVCVQYLCLTNVAVVAPITDLFHGMLQSSSRILSNSKMMDACMFLHTSNVTLSYSYTIAHSSCRVSPHSGSVLCTSHRILPHSVWYLRCADCHMDSRIFFLTALLMSVRS